MSETENVYVVWSKRDNRVDLQNIYEDLEDAKEAVDDNVPREVYGDNVQEIERGVYSQYGRIDIEFGWWVTRENLHKSGNRAGDVL